MPVIWMLQAHFQASNNVQGSQLIGENGVGICAAWCVKLLRIGHPFVPTMRFAFEFV